MDFNQIREQLLGADLNKGLQVRVGLEVSVEGCGKLAAFETQQQRHTAGCPALFTSERRPARLLLATATTDPPTTVGVHACQTSYLSCRRL